MPHAQSPAQTPPPRLPLTSPLLPRQRGDWGPWHLDATRRVLWIEAPGHYRISLDECTSSVRVLNWVAQVNGQGRTGERVMAGLVTALDDVLDLQGRLGGWGRSRRLTRRQVYRIAEAARRAGWHEDAPGD
jgi:hypothetical protein